MLSIIIVNFNSREITYQSILSIIQNDKNKNFEIILVDNASTDGSKEFFETLNIKNIKYIYNDNNVGFGKANNIGFKCCHGEYIYILNNDTLLHTQKLENIVLEKFNKHYNLGVLATKVQYEDGTLQPNVQNFTSLKTIFLRLLKVGYFVRNNKFLLKFFIWLPLKPQFIKTYLDNFDKQRKEEFVDWASGCSLIFKREVYEKLGGFDENFFMYTEDEELCYRVQQSGYKILYTPDILITHFEGKSNTNKKINEFLVKTKVESEFIYFKKHHPQKMIYLKLIYLSISILAFPFSKKFRIMHKTIRNLKI